VRVPNESIVDLTITHHVIWATQVHRYPSWILVLRFCFFLDHIEARETLFRAENTIWSIHAVNFDANRVVAREELAILYCAVQQEMQRVPDMLPNM